MVRVESRGLVLYNRNYRENDKLVKIFTEGHGKRMFFVRHAGKSKLNAVIQPLTLAHFILNLNPDGLSFIEDYREVQTFKNINSDIFKLAHASYLVSLADAALQDNVVDATLFDFLSKVLFLIEEGLDEAVLTNIFEVQILSRFGVNLNFNECAVCHRVGLPLDFSYKYSGCLCPDHQGQDLHRIQIDPNVIYLLSRFQAVTFDTVRKISVQDDMKRKLRQLLDQIYEEYVGIHLKTKKFIDDLEDWGSLLKKEE